jgi:hypothetical protein
LPQKVAKALAYVWLKYSILVCLLKVPKLPRQLAGQTLKLFKRSQTHFYTFTTQRQKKAQFSDNK